MTKGEIAQFSAAYGIEARYSGKKKLFYFHPILLGNLEMLKKNQETKVQNAKDEKERVRRIQELELTKERIEEAEMMKKEFELTETYTSEMKKHETSTV